MAAGARAGAEQIEGGEEIKESLDLTVTAAVPAVGIMSGAGKLYRRKKGGKRGKRNSREKQKGSRQAEISDGSRRKEGRKGGRGHGKNERKRNGSKESSGKKRGKGSVNGAVKGRMIDTFLMPSRQRDRSRKI